MTRCKQCLTKAEPLNGLCPVCGIEQEKKWTELLPAEKTVRFHARGIRAVAMFHLVAASVSLITLSACPAPLPMGIMATLNILLALGLSRFGLAAYKGAIMYYFMIGMVCLISIQHGGVYLGGVALVLIALYLIGNATSKAIFERRLP